MFRVVASPKRILIIRPSALGDVCRSVCVLASLHAAYPDARIDWLVQDSFAPAVASHPMLGRVIPFPRRKVAIGRLGGREARAHLRALLRSLAHPDVEGQRYDMVFDCQGLGRSGFFAWWTGAPERIGYANARELGWLGVNRRYGVSAQMHSVDRMLTLLERSGVAPVPDMRLYTSNEDRGGLHERLKDSTYVLVAPTSRWPAKRWPAERFAALIRVLLDRGGVERVAVVAGPDEREQCAPILELASREARVVDLIGKTSVGGLMAAVERSCLVVGNDSAPLHMAVGFDRPLVALFGPTSIELVGPYQRDADVLQAYEPAPGVTHKDEARGRVMMEALSLDRVAQACEERLAAKL